MRLVHDNLYNIRRHTSSLLIPYKQARTNLAMFQISNGTLKLAPPSYINASDYYVPSLFVGITNSVIAQFHESPIPRQNIGIYLNYLVSKYAMLCMFSAVVLNRIMLFGAVNNRQAHHNHHQHRVRTGFWRIFSRPLFAGAVKMALRAAILYQLWLRFETILTGLNCYSATANTFFSKYGVFTYNSSSTALPAFPFNATNFGISSPVIVGKDLFAGDKGFGKIGPSASFLWPLYITLCLSQFVETFCACISGTQPKVDTSQTLFEYLLGFYEFDSIPGLPGRPTPELLVLCLMAILNHSLVHILRLAGLTRYRLAFLGLVGTAFILYYIYTIANGTLLRFPTLVVILFLSQVITMSIILLCGAIYFSARLLAGPNQLRLNSLSLEDLNLSWLDDFNGFLANLAIVALSASAKETFVEELLHIGLPKLTWLDEQLKARSEPEKSDNISKSSYNNYLSSKDLTKLLKEKANRGEFTQKSWVALERFSKAKTVTIMFWRFVNALLLKRQEIEGRKELERRARQLLQPSIRDDEPFFEEQDGELIINYKRLLTGQLMSDENDSEFEEEEEETEIEEDQDDEIPEENAFADLLQPDDLYSLLLPDKDSDDSFKEILACHLSRDLKGERNPITRSQFGRQSQSEHAKLIDVIMEQRKGAFTKSEDNKTSEFLDEYKQYTCVICQSNPRQIILWPCTCFAICSNCRLTLVLRNFENCVCCRQPIEGYSKVYMP